MNSQVKGAPTIFQVCDELDNPIIGAETNTCPSIQENSFPHAVKPVVVWVGGKRKLLQKWSENMPIHSRNPGQYFEPFVGGGAVMLRNDFNNVTISDLNFDLINMYTVIRDDIDALKNKLKIHEKNHDENYYYNIRKNHNMKRHSKKHSISRAARFLYLNKACYGGLCRYNNEGEFNVSFNKNKEAITFDTDNLTNCSKKLKTTKIELQSYENINPQKGDLVYFDPPYDNIKENSFTDYTKEGFNKKDQVELRDFALKLIKKGVNVMLSNFNTPFIQKIYSDDLFEINIINVSHTIGKKSNKVEEVIIRNKN